MTAAPDAAARKPLAGSVAEWFAAIEARRAPGTSPPDASRIAIANLALRERALDGFDLSDIDFDNVDFSGAGLNQTKLIGCTFKDCLFGGARLAGAQLQGAHFDIGCRLDGADLSLVYNRRSTGQRR